MNNEKYDKVVWRRQKKDYFGTLRQAVGSKWMKESNVVNYRRNNKIDFILKMGW